MDRQTVIASELERRPWSSCSRRQWFRGAALLLSGLEVSAWGQVTSNSPKEEKEAVDQVQLRARNAKLPAFGQSRSAHFLALGDAPDRFQQEALQKICEPLGKDFLAYFRGRGFKVAYPDYRMTVVVLKNSDSFKAYIHDNPEEIVAGQYELDTNQLIMFDLRNAEVKLSAAEERVNTFALVHETIHLLCFNTGMLARTTDVPRAISEGLATYGELWTPHDGKARSKAFDTINSTRLLVLRNSGNDWIPISEVLTKDDIFDKPDTGQLAYAESWLLVHYLLRPQQLKRFQAYLEEVPKLGDAKRRVAYAEGHFGPLNKLDEALRRFGKHLPRR